VSDTLFPKGMFALCIIIRLGHVEHIRGQQSIMQMNTHSGTALVDSPSRSGTLFPRRPSDVLPKYMHSSSS